MSARPFSHRWLERVPYQELFGNGSNLTSDVVNALLRSISVDTNALYTMWSRIIPLFGNRLFAHREDILPAIAGLAERF